MVALTAFAVGTAGNLLKGLPQFVRTAVRGQVAGLAPGAVWLAFTANVLWLCFGLAIGDARFTAFSLLTTALTGVTLLRFVRLTGALDPELAVPSLVTCGACGLLAVQGRGDALAAGGVLLGVAVSLPQLVHLWRRRTECLDVSGVSQAEIVVVLVAQLGWTTYWITQSQPLAAAGAAYGGLARLATLLLLQQHRRSPTALGRASVAQHQVGDDGPVVAAGQGHGAHAAHADPGRHEDVVEVDERRDGRSR